jgi:uncharacterized protein YjeT (DUF2065 family)
VTAQSRSSPIVPEETVPSKGRFLRRFGYATLTVGLVVNLAMRFVTDSSLWPISLVSLVVAVCGILTLYRGKQWAAAEQSIAATEHAPQAAPVVYLRSFSADESAWKRVFGLFIGGSFFPPVLSDEEQLAQAVAPIGPLIGLGKPGEALPEPGATRLYPAQWHESVEQLLRRARLVILRPSTSESVLWELEQVFRTVDPENFRLTHGRRRTF